MYMCGGEDEADDGEGNEGVGGSFVSCIGMCMYIVVEIYRGQFFLLFDM